MAGKAMMPAGCCRAAALAWAAAICPAAGMAGWAGRPCQVVGICRLAILQEEQALVIAQ